MEAQKTVPAVQPKTGWSMGPRPLPLHMTTQALMLMTSLSALSLLRSGSLNLKGRAPAGSAPRKKHEATIAAVKACADPEGLAEAVSRQAVERLTAFADGVLAYRAFPRTERPAGAPVVWQRGSARLLDYGAMGAGGGAGGADGGRPVIVVPSLVNRSYILDLTERRSLVRYLAGAGLRPFLVDWDAPGDAEAGFSLTDYVAGYLAEAIGVVAETAGRAPVAIGYCMGGLLALAAARNNATTAGLALLATPWDFHADTPTLPYLRAMAPALETMIASLGYFPVDILQAMFASLEPTLTGEKFRRFANLGADSAEAKLFVALEDWLNDGVPLTAAVARECLFGWYLDNTPVRGAWRIDGEVVDPADVAVPSLVVVPERDHIVPPSSAIPLADLIDGADVWRLPAGHIGMVTGGRAHDLLYEPLAAWLNARFD